MCRRYQSYRHRRERNPRLFCAARRVIQDLFSERRSSVRESLVVPSRDVASDRLRTWPRCALRGDTMFRVLALLALAVSCVGCSAMGGPGCCDPVGCGAAVGCGDACCDSGCGCDTGCDTGCCEQGCETGCCGECGCEPGCGCGNNCGGGCCAGGCCEHLLHDCPICQDCRNCRMFRRGTQACGYDQCGESGPCYNDYDYSACQQCGHGPSWGCCGCCETYSGCCCQPSGPGCCASGDQNYNFAPGPPVAQTAYPYYTVRGPRDFLMANPPSIGPY
jgi:hypothetical protein